eukprot:Pgem_evm1s15120
MSHNNDASSSNDVRDFNLELESFVLKALKLDQALGAHIKLPPSPSKPDSMKKGLDDKVLLELMELIVTNIDTNHVPKSRVSDYFEKVCIDFEFKSLAAHIKNNLKGKSSQEIVNDCVREFSATIFNSYLVNSIKFRRFWRDKESYIDCINRFEDLFHESKHTVDLEFLLTK